MAQSKIDQFSDEEIFLARAAKAFSHPARISILKILGKKDECICGEIVGLIPLAQSTVSQHLKELKDAGIIRGEIEGPKSCYCIDTKIFEKIKNRFQKFFEELE